VNKPDSNRKPASKLKRANSRKAPVKKPVEEEGESANTQELPDLPLPGTLPDEISEPILLAKVKRTRSTKKGPTKKPAEEEEVVVHKRSEEQEEVKEETALAAATVKRTRSKRAITTKKANQEDEAAEAMPVLSDQVENSTKKKQQPRSTDITEQSREDSQGVAVRIDTPIPPVSLTYKNSIKKQRTRPVSDLADVGGTKNLADDLNDVLNEDCESENQCGGEEEEVSRPVRPPQGRWTKAKEAEWIKLERQRVVRLKLSQIENEQGEEVSVDVDRPRLVKFARTVILKTGEEQEPLEIELNEGGEEVKEGGEEEIVSVVVVETTTSAAKRPKATKKSAKTKVTNL